MEIKMPRARCAWSAFLAVSLLVGCGSSDAPADKEVNNGQGEPGRVLHIPLEGRTQLSIEPILFTSSEVIDDGHSSVTVAPEPWQVSLALGDDYPATLEIELGQLAGGSGCRLHGEPEILEVTGGGDAASSTRVDASTVRLQRGVEGQATVTVVGRFEPDMSLMSAECRSRYNDYDEFRFEWDLEVHTRQPSGIALEYPHFCEQAAQARFFPGDLLTGMSVQLVDASGEAFLPANASEFRPASLTVTAPAGADVDINSDVIALHSIRLPQVPGTVEITPAIGSSHYIEVVEPSKVTAVEVAFELPGFYGGPVDLDTGGSYNGADFAENGDHVFASLVPPAYIDGVPVCSGPPVGLFELSSATPEVCRIEERPNFELKSQKVSGWPTEKAARLLQDGTCELRLQSTRANNGHGLSASLAATFTSVDMLTKMEMSSND